MGNNNVTGQQEDTACSVYKIIEPSHGSPGLNNTDDNEKEGTQDEQAASYQNHSSSKIESADEKNSGSIQDSTSTEEAQSDNLSNEDHKQMKDMETQKTRNPSEIITLVSTTIEVMASIKDNLVSSEKNKQLEHGTGDRVRESTTISFFDENLEGSPEDGEEPRCHENAPMGNLAGNDSNDILEKGHIVVLAIEDKLMAMQGEITSSTESIVSTYHDADDFEVKEVVIEDKPGQKDKPSYMQPLDATNIEISKGYTTEIPQKKEEISEIVKTTTIEPMIVRDDVIEEYNPEYSAREVEQELEKHDINERVTSPIQISDSFTARVEHSGIVRTYMKEEGIAEKTVAVHNLAEILEREKEPEEYDGQLVSHLEGNGNLACLYSSYHLVSVNDGNENRVNGILECNKDTVLERGDLCNLPMIVPSTPVLLLENFETLGCIKPNSSDSNEGTITSTYGTRIIGTLYTVASSQGDQSQGQLLEEHEVVKLENGDSLSTCMQLVEGSLNIGNIFTDDSNHEKAGATATHIDFTVESNQEGDMTTTPVVSFIAEGNQVKVTAGVDKPTENQYPLETSTPMRESSEETPLLQRAESIDSFSNSFEQCSKVSTDKPMTDISVMQCKAEAEEESEKSPLLSPKEQSGEDFRDPNHSARKMKPFQNLLKEDKTGMLSTLKEQQSVSIDKNGLVSSPRSKGKQKTISSLFTNCICCVTSTN